MACPIPLQHLVDWYRPKETRGTGLALSPFNSVRNGQGKPYPTNLAQVSDEELKVQQSLLTFDNCFSIGVGVGLLNKTHRLQFNMKHPFRLVSLAALCAGLLVGAPAPAAHAGMFSVSPAQEKKLGQQAGADIEKSAPIVTGPVADWVNRIGQRLAKVSNPEFEYSFHVIDSPEINAFCLPGGHVFVYTGLRKVVKTDDELASVLAHEITHAEEHHYAKQYGRDSKRQTILGIGSILLGLPEVGQIGVGLLDEGLSAKYSRGNESEADRQGAARMKRAGFDPQAMVTVLTRLSNEDSTDDLDKWLADHPEGKKRAAAIQALIPTLPPYQNTVAPSVSGTAGVTPAALSSTSSP